MDIDIVVGVGVLIFNGDRVLLGKRKGSHGASTWGLPGGHLEAGESIETCATRETAEETGLSVKSLSHAGFASDVFEAERKHYITLFMVTTEPVGDARIMEPDKCDTWRWFAWNDLPSPLFAPVRTLVDQGYSPPLDTAMAAMGCGFNWSDAV